MAIFWILSKYNDKFYNVVITQITLSNKTEKKSQN